VVTSPSSTSPPRVQHGLQQLLHLSLKGLQAPLHLSSGCSSCSSLSSSLCPGGSQLVLQLGDPLLLCCQLLLLLHAMLLLLHQLLSKALEDQWLTLAELPTVLQKLQPHGGVQIVYL